MTPALPGSAYIPASATLPPAGLAGMDPRLSRLVTVPTIHSAPTWHLLDNGAVLEDSGHTPVGTILCVHGNPTWSYLWRELVAKATEQAAAGGEAWRVIAVDQLEMGFSERTGTHRQLADRVSDLSHLTEQLNISGPVVTLGHDWGGVVSLGWAVDHPDQLAAVMLLNTAVHQPETDPIPAPLRLALRPRVLGAATVATPGFLETTLALAHPRLSPDVREGYRAPYRGPERRGGIGAFVADIPVNHSHPSWRELNRIAAGVRDLGDAAVPALLLWGPRDPIFSDRYLQDLIERMPHADVHRFEGAGHLLTEDVDYSSAALTWLSDLGSLAANSAPSGADTTSAPTPLASAGSEDSSGSSSPSNTGDSVDSGDSSGASQPMWHQLDALKESNATALVEMAPRVGSGPLVVSWRLLAKRVTQIAAGLAKAGVRRGDRVSLLVPPGADLTAVLYACLRIGAVVVVADAGLGLKGLTRAVRGARPKHVIGALPGLSAARALGWPGQKISAVHLPRAVAKALGVTFSLSQLIELGAGQSLPPAPGQHERAAILFTSGSTGPAKGVVYTHAQLCAMRDVLASQYGIGVGTGLVAGFAPFALLGPALGARSVTPDMDVTAPKTLTARAVAAAVRAAEATIVFLSPAAVANVVATAADLTRADHDALGEVDLFLSAGAPVSESLLGQISELMPNASAHTPYGMTEGLLIADISRDGIRRALGLQDGSQTSLAVASSGLGGVCVGQPTSAVQVRISALDSLGQASGAPSAAAEVTGEILVSAPHIKDHYDRLWLTERLSRSGTSCDSDASSGIERWHRTGDVGHLDSEGRLWIEGRLSHVITAPDGVVTPVGVEQRIEQVEQVSRSALVGVGPQGTQQLIAIVELARPARRVHLAEAAQAALIRATAGVDLATVIVVPKMPTDIRHNSKIDRNHLARWAQRILSGGRMRQP